jgi:chromosome segregation ATPase
VNQDQECYCKTALVISSNHKCDDINVVKKQRHKWYLDAHNKSIKIQQLKEDIRDLNLGQDLALKYLNDKVAQLKQQLQEKQVECEEYSKMIHAQAYREAGVGMKNSSLEEKNKKLQAKIEAYQGHDCGYWEDVDLKDQLKERDQLIVEARPWVNYALDFMENVPMETINEWLEKTKDIKSNLSETPSSSKAGDGG